MGRLRRSLWARRSLRREIRSTFTAQPVRGARYTWLFGDGTQATGRSVRASLSGCRGDRVGWGSEWSRALQGSAACGRLAMAILIRRIRIGRRRMWWPWRTGTRPRASPEPRCRGLHGRSIPACGPSCRIWPRNTRSLPAKGPNLHADSQGFTRYAVAWDGFIDIPADGGYTFYLLDRDGARLVIDGVELAKTGPPFAQVCGAPGNAMRYDRGSLGLRAGRHRFHLEGLHAVSQGTPRLLWEGPGLPLTDVPPAAYSHPRVDAIKAGTRD